MCHEHCPGFKHTPLAQHVDIITQAQPYIEFRLHKRGSSTRTSSLRVLQRKVLRRAIPYVTQNKKLTLYADSALLIATGHLLLTRTSVRGVEIPKDGLLLRL